MISSGEGGFWRNKKPATSELLGIKIVSIIRGR